MMYSVGGDGAEGEGGGGVKNSATGAKPVRPSDDIRAKNWGRCGRASPKRNQTGLRALGTHVWPGVCHIRGAMDRSPYSLVSGIDHVWDGT